MFHRLCATTHANILAGTCPWCGREIVNGQPKADSTPERPAFYRDEIVIDRSGVRPSYSAASGEASDDVAFTEEFPSTPGAGKSFLDKVLSVLEDQGWAQRNIFAAHMAIEEMLVQAIKHSNDESTVHRIRVAVGLSTRTIRISIIRRKNDGTSNA